MKAVELQKFVQITQPDGSDVLVHIDHIVGIYERFVNADGKATISEDGVAKGAIFNLTNGQIIHTESSFAF